MARQPPNPPLIPGINKYLYQVKKIPIIGPWSARLGRVNSILGFPCHPTPEIWIEAFVYAFIYAILSIYSPTPTDYAMSRFRPGGEGAPGSSHGGRRGKKPKFDIDPFKMLPLDPMGVGAGVGLFALRGAQLLRFFGYWVTVIDATTDGLVNWASLAYQWSGCDQPGGKHAQAHATPGSVLLFQHAWLPYTEWVWDQHQFVTVNSQGFTAPRNKSIHVSGGMTSHPPPDVPGCQHATCIFRLANTTTGQYKMLSMGPGDGTGANYGSVVYWGGTEIGFDQSLRLEYYIDGCGFHIVDSGFLTYTETPINKVFKPMPPLKPHKE